MPLDEYGILYIRSLDSVLRQQGVNDRMSEAKIGTTYDSPTHGAWWEDCQSQSWKSEVAARLWLLSLPEQLPDSWLSD